MPESLQHLIDGDLALLIEMGPLAQLLLTPSAKRLFLYLVYV